MTREAILRILTATLVLGSLGTVFYIHKVTSPLILKCEGVARGAQIARAGEVKSGLYKLFVSQASDNGGHFDWKTWNSEQEEWVGYTRMEATKTKYRYGCSLSGDCFSIDRTNGDFYERRARPYELGDSSEWVTAPLGVMWTLEREVRGKCVPASEPDRKIEQIF